jgi:hypothetical protein
MFGEDVSALSGEELERELREQAAHVDAGVCRLVELAWECERRLNWSGDGISFAAWFGWRCSLSPSQALPDRHRRLGLRIDQHTCRNGTGDRMNLPLAVDAIITIAG